MVDKQVVKKLIKKYELAWKNRDPEAIIKIFTKNGTYHERAFKEPFKGHKEIKKYWEDKVVGEQERIQFKLLNLYVEGNTAIAEWSASFYDTLKKCRTKLKEVAFLEIKNGKIASLREYWHSEHEEEK